MKYAIATLAFLMMAAVGCAQVPPASKYEINLTWNAPVTTDVTVWKGCAGVAGSASDALPCAYAVYRCAGTTCSTLTLPAWQEISNPSARPSGSAFSDKTAAGLVSYVVETVQGGANSAPSNVYAAAIPVAPGAPGAVNGSMQTAMAPELEKLAPLPAAKTLAMNAPTGLRAR